MAAWMKVLGSILYDDHGVMGGTEKEPIVGGELLDKYRKALGTMYDPFAFDHLEDEEQFEKACAKARKACTVPYGSEGSLRWTLQPANEPYIDEDGGIAEDPQYLVQISGTLIDFTDFDKIEKWFKRCVCNAEFVVRQAVLYAITNKNEGRIWMSQDVAIVTTKNLKVAGLPSKE